MEWNLRYPLENNSRRIIAALVLKDVSANIIISHGNALSPTNSQAAAHDPSFTPTQSLLSRNQRLDDNQLRSLQGFVSLMGSLIQLRLTINQIEGKTAMTLILRSCEAMLLIRLTCVHYIKPRALLPPPP